MPAPLCLTGNRPSQATALPVSGLERGQHNLETRRFCATVTEGSSLPYGAQELADFLAEHVHRGRGQLLPGALSPTGTR